MEKPYDLKDRTRDFALRVIRLYTSLPKRNIAQVIGRQLLRSGTSPGANYREAIRSRSPIEYAAKLNTSVMELEETLYWFELLEGSGQISGKRLVNLKDEASQLIAIFISLAKKAKRARSSSFEFRVSSLR